MLSTSFITSSVSMVEIFLLHLFPRWDSKIPSFVEYKHALPNYRFTKFSFAKSRMNLTQKHCNSCETMTRQYLTASDKIISFWEWELNFNAEAIYQPLRSGCRNEFQFRRLSHHIKHKLINFVPSLTLFVCFLVSDFLFQLVKFIVLIHTFTH